MAKLTGKQQRFIDEYLIDLNATRAYKAAGYSVKSNNAAGVEGLKLLRNPKIQAYMKERQQKLQERTEITQDRVLLELARIAFSSGSDFAKVVTKPRTRHVWDDEKQEYKDKEELEQFVELVDTDELHADKKAAIASIKETKFGIAVESCDKVKALELIGKHLGMFTDKLKIVDQSDNPLKGFTTEELKKMIFDG